MILIDTQPVLFALPVAAGWLARQTLSLLRICVQYPALVLIGIIREWKIEQLSWSSSGKRHRVATLINSWWTAPTARSPHICSTYSHAETRFILRNKETNDIHADS